MATYLFDSLVFGPVRSRRFGNSLGINLLPVMYKFCTFNCIYCECGWTHHPDSDQTTLPTRTEISGALEKRLQALSESGNLPDNITFAGNGEPTLHPRFREIIDDTLKLRNRYCPETMISVLSNSSIIHKPSIFEALNKVDNNVLKLDSVVEETFRILNQPYPSIDLPTIIENIRKFNGNQIIQTLFIRGVFKGSNIDNTTKEEIGEWIRAMAEINPKYVMVYSIDRETAAGGLERVEAEELDRIARKLEKKGIKSKVYV